MYNPILSIVIPTYSRLEAFKKTFEFLEEIPKTIEILIVDDHSNDGTYEYLNRLITEQRERQNIKLLHNKKRLGFRGNFLSLFDLVNSEYLLFCSDDDFLCGEEVLRLNGFLSSNRQFSLLSTIFRAAPPVIDRGSDCLTELGFEHYRLACNHLPGLCFNVQKSRKVIKKYRDVIDTVDNFYPQVYIFLGLLCSGDRACFAPFEPVKIGLNMPSGIAKYMEVGSRIKEVLHLINFLQILSDDYPEVSNKILDLKTTLELSFFNYVGIGVREQFGDAAAQLYLKSSAFFFRPRA